MGYKYRFDKVQADEKTGRKVWVSAHPFSPGIIACEAVCRDGVVRKVYITNHADSFFSIPARGKANGKTLTGFITTLGGIDGYVFCDTGKNRVENRDFGRTL